MGVDAFLKYLFNFIHRLFFRQAFVRADVLHLLLDALFAVFEAHSVLQCAQPLDVLCVKNHVCGGFDVTVKPF
jgi:hypothetical protein